MHTVLKESMPVATLVCCIDGHTKSRCSSVGGAGVGHLGHSVSLSWPGLGHLLPSPELESLKLAMTLRCLDGWTYRALWKDSIGGMYESDPERREEFIWKRDH